MRDVLGAEPQPILPGLLLRAGAPVLPAVLLRAICIRIDAAKGLLLGTAPPGLDAVQAVVHQAAVGGVQARDVLVDRRRLYTELKTIFIKKKV